MIKDKLRQLWTKRIIRISSISSACIIVISILAGGIAAVYAQKDTEAFGGEIVRLHILANSDRANDQALKLKVRDAVLEVADDKIKLADDITSVKPEIENELALFEETARKIIRQEGYDYDVKVLWGVFPFPIKTYGNVTLPAGDYRAVRIIIGDGEGQNWWCVMFPPLCFVDETHAKMPDSSIKKLSTGTQDIIKKPKYSLRFKIVDIFSK